MREGEKAVGSRQLLLRTPELNSREQFIFAKIAIHTIINKQAVGKGPIFALTSINLSAQGIREARREDARTGIDSSIDAI